MVLYVERCRNVHQVFTVGSSFDGEDLVVSAVCGRDINAEVDLFSFLVSPAATAPEQQLYNNCLSPAPGRQTAEN